MSKAITNAVRPLKMPATAKAVLIALADYADDSGAAWPSIASICEFTCICERAVQNAIKTLVDGGFISRKQRGHANAIYQINACKPAADAGLNLKPAADAPASNAGLDEVKPAASAGMDAKPAADAGLEGVKPASGAFKPAPDAPNPKATTSKDKDKRKGASAPSSDAIALPDWLPRTEWAAFVEMRKRIRSPLTDRAVTLLIGKLEELRTAGHSPATVLDQSTMNGWKGVFEIKSAGTTQAAKRPGVHIGEQAYGQGWGK